MQSQAIERGASGPAGECPELIGTLSDADALRGGAQMTVGLALCLLLGGVFSGHAEAWMYTEGQGVLDHVAQSVALDGAGDVIVSGRAGSEAPVAKLDGTTGEVLWRVPDVAQPPQDGAREVAVDSAGNVFVGMRDLVVKLDGTNGMELWRRSVDGWPLFVDTAGDAYAGSGGVIKLSGVDGTTVWNAAGPTPQEIAVDTSGDVFVGDGSGNLTKLDGSAAGAQLWQADVSFEGGTLTVDAAGDVIAGTYKVSGADGTPIWTLPGMFRSAVDSSDDVFAQDHTGFSTVGIHKLSGIDGTTIWSRTWPGGASRVTVTAGDDVIVAGVASDIGYVDVVVAKYRGTDGTQLWRRDITGGPVTRDGADMVLTADDDVVIAGALGGSAYRLFAAKMTGPSPGTKIVVRDKDGDPTRRRLVVKVRDPSLFLAPPGSPGDPTIGGATLQLINPSTGETGTMVLPAEHWEVREKTVFFGYRFLKGYRYKDTSQSAGPCRKLKLDRQKSFKVNCQGSGIPFSLDEPAGQGELEVRLVMGTETLRHCVVFGGDIKRDSPAEAGGTGLFKAVRSIPPVSCGEEVGSPGAAFLSATETLMGW